MVNFVHQTFSKKIYNELCSLNFTIFSLNKLHFTKLHKKKFDELCLNFTKVSNFFGKLKCGLFVTLQQLLVPQIFAQSRDV